MLVTSFPLLHHRAQQGPRLLNSFEFHRSTGGAVPREHGKASQEEEWTHRAERSPCVSKTDHCYIALCWLMSRVGFLCTCLMI
uniref:Uncharacterized protein n=1 Tax=Anguilla anguilla TaxID=7936 RepID=A0A0E9WRE2_ANGAN